MKLFWTAIIASTAAVSVSLAADQPVHLAGRGAKIPNSTGYFNVEDSDKTMKRAVDQAQRSLGFFIAALKANKPDDSEFAIKKGFTDGDNVEHLWINELRWDGKNFHGKIDNRPVDVRNVWLGEPVIVAPEDVSDWMFVKDNTLMGGYTTRVLYQRLNSEEKARFDNQVRFKIQ
ncbi:MAG TPA: DUF2314 domain-containing protein [Chthoniobacterales bacterium]|nr:DUF2314 domain-containing protein [Chthoniobacterales bacterium]